MKFNKSRLIYFIIILLFGLFISINLPSNTLSVEAEENTSEQPDPSSDPEVEDPINILFVGNSFTSYNGNNVGEILENIAASQGKNIVATSICHGSAKLIYYAFPYTNYQSYYKELQLALLTGDWDYIVLQEQSKYGIEDPEGSMFPAIEHLKTLIDIYQPEAEILLYMTHGYVNGSLTKVNGNNELLSTTEFQQYVQMSYKYIADKLELRTVPVGEVFARTNYNYPEINLISSDNKHPNYTGYFLAASCFYRAIFNEAPTDATAEPDSCSLTEETREKLYKMTDDFLALTTTIKTIYTGQEITLKCVTSIEDEQITWESLNSSIASIDENGLLTAKKPGTALIMARTASGLQDLCYIKVEDKELYKKGFIFATSYYNVEKGDKLQVVPQISSTILSDQIKWSVSSKSIASVTSDGIVTALAPGKVTVTVTDKISEKSASYVIYVRFTAPTKISVKTVRNATNKTNEADINIKWSSVEGATKYIVYRSSYKNGTYVAIGTTSNRSYTDSKVKTARRYYYRVSASNSYANCESAKSTVYAVITAPTTPTIKKTYANNKKIKITWSRITSASGYIIYRSSNNGKTYKEVARTTSNRKISYTDTNVKKRRNYLYKVVSYRNANDTTYYSNYSPAVKIKAYKPAKAKN